MLGNNVSYGDLMDVGSVKRIHQSDWRKSGIRFLRARDIVAYSKKEEPDEYLYIDREKYEEYSRQSGKVKKGDLLVTGVGTIGVPMLINTDKSIYFKDGNIIWFKNNNMIDGEFFYYNFNSKNVQSFITESAGTGTVGTYTIESGKNTPMNLPENKKEQHKIGTFFKELDHLITLHQRKCDSLIMIKKALLEKMFPKNGENYPEIRFRGFTDAWEQRELKELGEIKTGNTPSTAVNEYYSSDGMQWVTPTDITTNIVKTTAKKLSKEGEKVARIVPANTILCTCIASLGKNAIVLEKSAFNQQINSLTTNEKLHDPYFLLTNSFYWSKSMKELAGGLTFQIVNKTEFSEIETWIPNDVEEEKKIGTYFKQLDNLITLHQRKLEKLKNVKKSLLEKMFV